MFHACQNKGFQITFENGWTASVQWGPGNYCQNKDIDKLLKWASKDGRYTEQSSETAEVAAWDAAKRWYNFDTKRAEDDTDVKGHCTPTEVLKFLNVIAAMRE